ncbi:uncharacterized protein GGS22DRAFT_196446 [Annulohypoxylon maeteangense]|uniref:uncharacterized protein n=1 Tax=Annulohypoxylon maeteangense TaxID=1927788 RepID=UPI00200878E3|nr:uncharacterized protein GGS22DRAFT_196446 [Annulohypoxylon maeteangense]KAI0881496.1 hypothetical protein GGS22DRAFT_196446 [Annulohypoxylon maeteangense]
MHPAPSLSEAFPKDSKTEDRGQHVSHQHDQQQQQQQQQQSSGGHHRQPSQPQLQQQPHQGSHPEHVQPQHGSLPASPSQSATPIRKDTGSSTSTTATDATAVSNATTDTNSTAYSVESSQSIFSVKDGSEISHNRRASRRRTGPLSAQQREKAALIRKLGACADCRRRRVACHPNHHNMTWEDAMRKYRSSSPLQDLAPLAGRPISPAPNHVRHHFTQDPQEMEIDSTPAAPNNAQSTPGRPPLNDARIRTPLPSGPRLEKPMSNSPLAATTNHYTPLSSIDSVKVELESAASRILASPHRSRYSSVCALLIYWQDDENPDVASAVEELGIVFDKYYRYAFEILKIPSSASDGCTNSWRWLSRIINEFTDKSDTRDVLKLVYYNGYSYLDEHREMVLARRASTIRWSGIQQILEEARSDTLIMMDAAYYPSSKMVRQKGVLEVIAASSSEEYFDVLDRNSFTRTLVDQLRTRATQRLPNPLSAAELHSKLLSIYPKIIQDKHQEKGIMLGFPSPLHIQISSNSRLPSITLSPPQPPRTIYSPENHHGPQLTFSMRLTDEALNIESWAEWLRMMPEGIKDIKVESPYATFR